MWLETMNNVRIEHPKWYTVGMPYSVQHGGFHNLFNVNYLMKSDGS